MVDCNIFFNKSQVTLISKKYVEKLCLKSNGTKLMQICGIWKKERVVTLLTLMPSKVGHVTCGPYRVNSESNDKYNCNSNFVYSKADNACEAFTRSSLNISQIGEIHKNIGLSRIFSTGNLVMNIVSKEIDERLKYEIFERKFFFFLKTLIKLVLHCFVRGNFSQTIYP